MDLAHVRPTRVEVDLDAVAENVQRLAALAPGAHLMAVVKADGYGHGAIPVARVALEAGATWLGVATLEEAIALRQSGLTPPILVLGYVPPTEADALLRYDLRPTIFDMALAEALSRSAAAMGCTAPIHLKVDTGMGRLGLRIHEAVAFAQGLVALPAIHLEGIFTHLATADEPENPYTGKQLATFEAILDGLRAVGIDPPIRHAVNSAGLMLHPIGHHTLVRAGIALYGQPPDPSVTWPVKLRPALTWRTEVALVKQVEAGTALSYGCTYRATTNERIATLPVGYADGYFRQLSNKGEVLIHGHRCPVVGRVCMDQLMVRLPDDLPVAPGDEAILIGEQLGESISASDLARAVGTINYEVLCAIAKRVPRIYCQNGREQRSATCQSMSRSL